MRNQRVCNDVLRLGHGIAWLTGLLLVAAGILVLLLSIQDDRLLLPSIEDRGVEAQGNSPVPSALAAPAHDSLGRTEGAEPSRQGKQPHRAPGLGPLMATVVDAISGEPVTRFKVFHLPQGKGDIWDFAERRPSDALSRHDFQGRFRIEELAPGPYSVLVDPGASGYTKTAVHLVVVPCSDPIEIRVGRGPHLEGRLFDRRGQGIPNVPVCISKRPGDSEAPVSITRETDDAGRFLFTTLQPGEYNLALAGDSETAGGWFSIGENEQVERDLRLPYGSSLRVGIADCDGRPLPGASIRLWGRKGSRRRSVTDSTGRADLNGLNTDAYAIQITCDGFRGASQTIDLDTHGDEYLDIMLCAEVD